MSERKGAGLRRRLFRHVHWFRPPPPNEFSPSWPPGPWVCRCGIDYVTREDSRGVTSMTERLVLRAIPAMPEATTARRLAVELPFLSRSTIDRALRSLSSYVMVYRGRQGRLYSRYVERSLL